MTTDTMPQQTKPDYRAADLYLIRWCEPFYMASNERPDAPLNEIAPPVTPVSGKRIPPAKITAQKTIKRSPKGNHEGNNVTPSVIVTNNVTKEAEIAELQGYIVALGYRIKEARLAKEKQRKAE